MLAKILIGVVLVCLVLLVVVALQPAAYHVERSISLAAPPERAFAAVNDFHAWGSWSPWEAKDPAMKRTYDGPASGVGAAYHWSGNKEVGEGRMTIQKSDPGREVAVKLEFIKPFPGTSTATYSFVPEGAGTRVTWAMDGRSNFVMKAFHLVVNIDKLLGADFERGLAAMKRTTEMPL